MFLFVASYWAESKGRYFYTPAWLLVQIYVQFLLYYWSEEI